MSEIRDVVDQLKRAYEGEAWHGPSLREVLVNISAEQAAAKPIPKGHSIWEIVLHIAAWEGAVRRRLSGDPAQLTPEEDWPGIVKPGDTAWQETLSRLENVESQLREAVSQLTEARLNDIVPGKPYTVRFMLHGVIHHSAYHAGQIALLKKAI